LEIHPFALHFDPADAAAFIPLILIRLGAGDAVE
jgi:hypothetical protein